MNKKGKLTMSFDKPEDETLIKALSNKDLYSLERSIRDIVRKYRKKMKEQKIYILPINLHHKGQNRYFKYDVNINYLYKPNIDVQVKEVVEFDSMDAYTTDIG